MNLGCGEFPQEIDLDDRTPRRRGRLGRGQEGENRKAVGEDGRSGETSAVECHRPVTILEDDVRIPLPGEFPGKEADTRPLRHHRGIDLRKCVLLRDPGSLRRAPRQGGGHDGGSRRKGRIARDSSHTFVISTLPSRPLHRRARQRGGRSLLGFRAISAAAGGSPAGAEEEEKSGECPRNTRRRTLSLHRGLLRLHFSGETEMPPLSRSSTMPAAQRFLPRFPSPPSKASCCSPPHASRKEHHGLLQAPPKRIKRAEICQIGGVWSPPL